MPSVGTNEYEESMASYLREKEGQICPKEGFLKQQTEINDRARSKVINWMIKCQLRFHFSNESLFLAVSLLDRFLEKQQIDKKSLGLVGVAALLIAWKYEEVCPLRLEGLLSCSNEKCSPSKVHNMELQLLKALNFEIVAPTTLQFLQRVCQDDRSAFTLTLYICENQLLYSDMAKYMPSLIGLSGFYIAKKANNKYYRIEDLPLKDFKYTKEDIRLCAKSIVINMLPIDSSELLNIRKKYSIYESINTVIFNTNLIS